MVLGIYEKGVFQKPEGQIVFHDTMQDQANVALQTTTRRQCKRGNHIHR